MANQTQNTQSRNARAATGQIYFMPEEAPLVRALLPEGAFFSVMKPITGESAVRYAEVFGSEYNSKHNSERKA